MRNVDTETTSSVSQRVDDEELNWNFEDTVSSGGVAPTRSRGKLQEAQRLCNKGGETAHTTVVEAVELAREGAEGNHSIVALSERSTDVEAELVKARAVKSKMRDQLALAERRLMVL